MYTFPVLGGRSFSGQRMGDIMETPGRTTDLSPKKRREKEKEKGNKKKTEEVSESKLFHSPPLLLPPVFPDPG